MRKMAKPKYKDKGIRELKKERAKYKSSSKAYKRLSAAISRKRKKRYASRSLLRRLFG